MIFSEMGHPFFFFGYQRGENVFMVIEKMMQKHFMKKNDGA